ncbi:hypothetical protein [Flavobacterium psychrophilum]|uniref:Uncharacterized protein n=1 Tax=Flavobacterium psychrophilum TaxID=96345 RepID=A0A7U2R9R2_FLAPS|nr:hypothetical protein [Flavobacterium psychrophilum]QRE03514.1 hypothetical protein H0H26_11580 [Flavobacterium psychrophilum]
MAIVTPEQYHNTPDNHGNYQYVSLKEVVNSLELEALDDDSFLKNTKRYQMVRHAKNAIKEVTKQAANEVLAIEITVPNNLVFALPQDYVNYVRVSVVVIDASTGSKRLQVLDVNNKMNISTGYLQDNNAGILFDNNGYILTSDGDNAYGQPYKTYSFTDYGGQLDLDTAKLSQYGEFTIDERRGKILFSSELGEREIVLEYVSDGLQAEINEEKITIHKHIVNAIRDWTYYACIECKRNVPMNEKKRALDRYKTTLHQAKLDRSDFNFVQIARVFRTKTMNI